MFKLETFGVEAAVVRTEIIHLNSTVNADGLATCKGRELICHEGKPVAIREKIFKILSQAHRQCQHGGRDKTSAQVRRIYSWCVFPPVDAAWDSIADRIVKGAERAHFSFRQNLPNLSIATRGSAASAQLAEGFAPRDNGTFSGGTSAPHAQAGCRRPGAFVTCENTG